MNSNHIRRTALITGSTSGIGLELTRILLAEGWEVIGLNRSAFPKEDSDIQDGLRSGQLRWVQANLTQYDSLRKALNQIKSETDTIDVLFNNAGGAVTISVCPIRGMKCILNCRRWCRTSFIWNYRIFFTKAP